jgi:hypothetical protein
MMLRYGGDAGVFGAFHLIFAVVVLVDLILLGLWLWKQIQKK